MRQALLSEDELDWTQNKMAASLSSKVLHRDFIRCCRLTYRQLRSIRTIASSRNREFQITDIKKADEKIQFTSIDGETPARMDSSVSSLPSYKQLTEQQVHPLMAMPFNVISGGKFAIHLLKKFDSKRVIILVRAAVLATELCIELKENGISCLDGTSLTKQEVEMTGDKEFIIVGCYQDANRHSFPKADLIIMVQPPVDGIHSVIRFLLQQSFNTSSGKAVMLYNENDLSSLKEIQQYVEVVKLSPPSFFSVKQPIDIIPHNSSAGLPSVRQEEPLTEMERPLPAKVPKYAMFRPTVPVPRASSGRTRLNDYVRLYVRGGSGGQGSLTYAGLGGDGGNVILQCQQGATFNHFSLKQNRRVIAGHGGHFTKEKRKKKGLRGLDVIVPVPPGTTVSTDDGQFLAEMNDVGSRLIVAHGGQGGNPSTEGWGGEKGNCQMIRLNLRLMADVGLVGFPNAGKSSLLGEISRASVKTGDFPFTTVRPSIGMMEFSDHFQISVADLPGLVEGAHLNRGMGHKFLKHVERTTVLLLVVDVNGFQLSNQHPKRNAFQSLCLLAKELYFYNSRLANRPKVLVVTKMDCDNADKQYTSFLEDLNGLKQQGLSSVLQDIEPDKKIQQAELSSTNHLVTDSLEFEEIIPLSVITGTGMEQLRQRLRKLLID